MNMFARFDENPAMTLQDIKETKRYGRTDARTDNVKTVHPTTNKVCGGYNNVPWCFCRLLIFFSKSSFLKKNFGNTIWVSNRLDPEQAWLFVGLICVQTDCKSYQQTTLADKKLNESLKFFQVAFKNWGTRRDYLIEKNADMVYYHSNRNHQGNS